MATVKFELDLDLTSPYRQTKLYVKDGRVFFGRWRPPEITLDGDEEEYIVKQGEDRQLDLLAHRIYGDRRLWWVIAHANKINFVHEEVVVGRKLVIPKLGRVRAALLAASARGTVGET